MFLTLLLYQRPSPRGRLGLLPLQQSLSLKEMAKHGLYGADSRPAGCFPTGDPVPARVSVSLLSSAALCNRVQYPLGRPETPNHP